MQHRLYHRHRRLLKHNLSSTDRHTGKFTKSSLLGPIVLISDGIRHATGTLRGTKRTTNPWTLNPHTKRSAPNALNPIQIIQTMSPPPLHRRSHLARCKWEIRLASDSYGWNWHPWSLICETGPSQGCDSLWPTDYKRCPLLLAVIRFVSTDVKHCWSLTSGHTV